MSDKPKRRKRKPADESIQSTDPAVGALDDPTPDGVEVVYSDTGEAVENPHLPEDFKAKVKAKYEPSAASLARRKRDLINELKSEDVTPERQIEVRKIINGELKDVPILSHQEISRLGA